MTDRTISLAAAIEMLHEYFDGMLETDAVCPTDLYNGIEALPSAQTEPAIPLSWIEGQIEWLKSLDNDFSILTAGQISAMVNKWKDEQNERSD